MSTTTDGLLLLVTLQSGFVATVQFGTGNMEANEQKEFIKAYQALFKSMPAFSLLAYLNKSDNCIPLTKYLWDYYNLYSIM